MTEQADQTIFGSPDFWKNKNQVVIRLHITGQLAFRHQFIKKKGQTILEKTSKFSQQRRR